MKFYIVDAFTEELFGGNPAGVVLLPGDFLSEALMTKTAAELRYSETAFIKPLSAGEFEIRYFTPADEVDLCGHATIASFTVLQEEGLVPESGECTLHTKAGTLQISVKDGLVMMEMAKPKMHYKIADPVELAELYEIMGLLDYERHLRHSDCCVCERTLRSEDESHLPASGKIRNKDEVLLPALTSSGLTDIMLPVCCEEALEAIKPRFEALAALSARYEVVGVHAFCVASAEERQKGITAHCRNFAPLYEIDEEAATGTSNAALTYYMRCNGIIKDHTECTFVQGEAMGRPSLIKSRIDGEKILIGGRSRILAVGEINLE